MKMILTKWLNTNNKAQQLSAAVCGNIQTSQTQQEVDRQKNKENVHVNVVKKIVSEFVSRKVKLQIF